MNNMKKKLVLFASVAIALASCQTTPKEDYSWIKKGLDVACLLYTSICNGKIYVAPRSYQGEEPGKLDIPMDDYIYACKTDTVSYTHLDVYKRQVTDFPVWQ